MSRVSLLPLARLFGVLAACVPAHALTFSEWQSVHFNAGQLANPALIAPAADPDADGLSNLAEYVFTGDPLFSDPDLLPRLSLSDGHLSLTYRERADLSDAGVWLQSSDDLLYWTTFNNAEVSARIPVTVPDSGFSYADVTLRDPVAYDTLGNSKRFLRLNLQLRPFPPLQAPGNFGVAVENNDHIRLRWSDW
ncbi:MAG: hypothetical protein NTU80_14640, partial [Verrucomicrobia bacterium]|nr:hypothetical protein [Verrucomicrobiota bacterium]